MISTRLRNGILSILAGLMSTAGIALPPVIFEDPLSPRTVDYAIDVRLNAEDHTLKAGEAVTWRNQSDDVITDLQFHLYLNAFRNNRSTFFKESGAVRGMEINVDSGWGFIEITNIALSSGEDLTGLMEFIQPDNDHIPDKTVMRLPLPQPIKPGDSIKLIIDFTAKLPTPPIRTGYKDEYFFIGQWFPKVGVYIDGAWNCHQFHADAEFFADFGVYDVRMTVPQENIVGATGLEINVTANDDGTATHSYHAEDVHDFAWTTSPEFVVFATDTQDVAIRILMQPDRVDLVDRYLYSAKVAIAYLQDWIGDYPFPNLTVVDPRRGALNSGGMEYPTLFTTLGLYGLPDGLRLIEGTTIHEAAHGYWQHLVASNEFEEAWLDEGLTTYSEAKIMNDVFGPTGDMIDIWGIKINQQTLSRGEFLTYPDRDPIVRNAWDFYSSYSYAVNSFFRPATMLFTLENYLGDETMRQILRTYYERWRFKHPHTRDFIEVVNEVSGENLDWFFDQALYSNAILDYSVSWVSSKVIDSAKGYDFTLDPFDDEKPDSVASDEADDVGDASDDDEEKIYLSRIKIRRLGTFVFPVEVAVEFDDGEIIRENWDGQDTWTEFRYTRPAKLVSATVDPDRKIRLDVNFTNNSRSLESDGYGVARMSLRTLFWAQFMMEQPDFANLLSIFEGFSLE